jgi:hypothetical protein
MSDDVSSELVLDESPATKILRESRSPRDSYAIGKFFDSRPVLEKGKRIVDGEDALTSLTEWVALAEDLFRDEIERAVASGKPSPYVLEWYREVYKGKLALVSILAVVGRKKVDRLFEDLDVVEAKR